jgi:hypothetical protein
MSSERWSVVKDRHILQWLPSRYRDSQFTAGMPDGNEHDDGISLRDTARSMQLGIVTG